MIKKAVFYMGMTGIVLLCLYSIYLMYQTDARYEVSLEPDKIVTENGDDEIYVAKKTTITQTVSLQGTVAPFYGDEQVEVHVEGVPNKIERYVEVDDVIEKDTVYAKYNGKEYKSESKLYCVSVEETGGVVFTFVDYSKLYVEVGVPEIYAVEALRGKEVALTNNGTAFSGIVSFMDGYCNDGVVRTRVIYDSESVLLRPGAVCTVSVVLQQKEEAVAIPSAFVIYSEYEDEYRAILTSDGRTTTVKVQVGIIGDDLVEILSGIRENDCVMLPAEEMSLQYYRNRQEE